MTAYFKTPIMCCGIFLLQLVAIQQAFSQNIKLSPLFSDHIVLQQKTKAAIWGKAMRNSEIQITGSWGEGANAHSVSDSYIRGHDQPLPRR